ncbi:copper amine oxidase N-terminal domain-containing protein [Paenibacillus sp. 7541]|uniref:copper amine oxidase N-terminal domain-containing protein n=1 Tax=Paenibacillus sp. 7541 TaxID=2026236 RepID=UPI000BA71497|nr:copper amine oxidase N-terminal domain-containing protein [Paenibacillus sp. 7541]PAK55794.1 hypothetical protein CHH75_00555 [Paenibacillus sp. 7541]
MKKKVAIITTLLLTLISPSVLPSVNAAPVSKQVVVDGQRVIFDLNPIIVDGTTLVQFTPVFKKLGITSTWNQEKKQVVATKGSTRIILNVGNKTAYVNGSPVNLQVAPTVVAGKVFVPLRFISESTGASLSIRNNGNVIEVFSGNGRSISQPAAQTTKSAPTSVQVRNYLDQNYGALGSGRDLYDVYYTSVVQNETILVGIFFDFDDYMILLDNALDDSYIYKLTKPIAKDLQARYGSSYDVNLLLYLEFESPFYTSTFGIDNIEPLSNGNYQILKPSFYSAFSADSGEAESYFIDFDGELYPMYYSAY